MSGFARLVGSLLVRALREGLLVRALAWPGLLTALALIGSAGAVATMSAVETIAVTDLQLADDLEDAGLIVERVKDPAQLFAEGEADRAAWSQDGEWVLAVRHSGRDSLLAESVLRDHAEARWRLEVPPLSGRDARTGQMTGVLVGLLGVLFTLYGVVFGAGSLLRDRDDGTLEAERALPLPDWVHAASRLTASGILLALGLTLSVALIHTLMGVDAALSWCVAGAAAGVSGAAIGLGAMSGGGETLSGPLARGMSLAMGLLGLGWAFPQVGAHLPIASLGALIRGDAPSVVVAVGTVLLAALACWRFARSCR